MCVICFFTMALLNFVRSHTHARRRPQHSLICSRHLILKLEATVLNTTEDLMKYKVVRMWRNVDVKIERCKISIKTLDVFFLLVMVKSSKKTQTCSLRPDFADVVGIYLFFFFLHQIKTYQNVFRFAAVLNLCLSLNDTAASCSKAFVFKLS